jgi:hypothetical protein
MTVRPSSHEIGNAVRLGVAAMLFLGSGIVEVGMGYRFLVGGILALGAVRTVLMSLQVDDRSVRIRNRWRTYNLPWAEVRDVEIADLPNALLAALYGARTCRVVLVATRGRIPVVATTTVRLTKGPFRSRVTSDLDSQQALQSLLLRRLERWRSAGQG